MRLIIALSLLISFGGTGAIAGPLVGEAELSDWHRQAAQALTEKRLGSENVILLAKKKKDSDSENAESSNSDDSANKDGKKGSGFAKESSGSTKEATGTATSNKESNSSEKNDAEAEKKTAAGAKDGAGSAASTEKPKGGKTFSGNASWYGIPFHGHKTASGEIFNMNKCSAAHLTLPLLSKALVEDPRTGNAVIVKVNDRGPYVKTRVMDLSREAARELGTLPRGVAFVDITVLESPNRTRKTQ